MKFLGERVESRRGVALQFQSRKLDRESRGRALGVARDRPERLPLPRPRDGPRKRAAPSLGQISPLAVALAVRGAAEEARGTGAARVRDAAEVFLEQLVVRRELAVNFVWYSRSAYDRDTTLPEWARDTLRVHARDRREAVYDRATLETCGTDDPWWNAAMEEMRRTGWLHNHLRMYWGKRILGWTRTPERAFRIARDLNDRWFLDGRDPSSYANVGWLFGLHDRPWPERRVYGTVRTMTRSGLTRKFGPEPPKTLSRR